MPDRPEAAHVDAGLSAGMRVMAKARDVPPGFTLKNQLEAAHSMYATLTYSEEKRRAMAQIADLEMRYNMARDARRKFRR